MKRVGVFMNTLFYPITFVEVLIRPHFGRESRLQLAGHADLALVKGQPSNKRSRHYSNDGLYRKIYGLVSIHRGRAGDSRGGNAARRISRTFCAG